MNEMHPIRVGLLGVDDDALKLVRGLVRARRGELVCVCAPPDRAAAVESQMPGFERLDRWESLLVMDRIDIVVVASSENQAELDDGLRKLAQAAVPLLMAHPLCDALLAFELEMICEESGGSLVPFFPGCAHPGIERMAELVQLANESPIGPVEEIVVERRLPHRGVKEVMRWLARDVRLIGRLVGSISNVSAVGSQRDDSSYANLSIHLAGAQDIHARWSLGAVCEDPAGSIVMNGRSGAATLSMAPGDEPWTLDVSEDPTFNCRFADWDESAAVADAVRSAALKQPNSPTWWEVCHDLDICDNAQRSFRRKRTIAIRHDDRSEEGAFKGVMAASGCLLLMVALCGLLAGAVVEGFRMPFVDDRPADAAEHAGERLSFWIRLWPVYPLLIFLLLQPLLLVAKRATPTGSLPVNPAGERDLA